LKEVAELESLEKPLKSYNRLSLSLSLEFAMKTLSNPFITSRIMSIVCTIWTRSPHHHHHHHKEGSDHHHTKDCEKRWKAQGITITTITRNDQIITIPRIVTKDGKPRASPSPPPNYSASKSQ